MDKLESELFQEMGLKLLGKKTKIEGMERPDEIWWCRHFNEYSTIHLLRMIPKSSCRRSDGKCFRDSKSCDAVKGKIEWEEK